MEQQPYRTTADLRIKKAQVTLDSSFASVLSTTPTVSVSVKMFQILQSCTLSLATRSYVLLLYS